MSERDVDVELRFGSDAGDSVDMSVANLKGLNIEIDKPRDPLIAAVISITASAVTLAVELIKLARELKSRGKKEKILIVKLDVNNQEKTVALLEASDEEIREFVSS